jgi:hypothetical protein
VCIGQADFKNDCIQVLCILKSIKMHSFFELAPWRWGSKSREECKTAAVDPGTLQQRWQ